MVTTAAITQLRMPPKIARTSAVRCNARPTGPVGRAAISACSVIDGIPPLSKRPRDSVLLRVLRLQCLDLGEDLGAVVAAVIQQLHEAVEHRFHLGLELGG